MLCVLGALTSTSCRAQPGLKIRPRPDDRYLGSTPWSVYAWRDDVLRLAPDPVEIDTSADEWTVGIPSGGGVAFASQPFSMQAGDSLFFSAMLSVVTGPAGLAADLYLHERDRVKRVGNWRVGTRDSITELEMAVVPEFGGVLWLDIRFSTGPAVVKLAELNLKRSDIERPVFSSVFAAPEASVVTEGDSITIVRQAAPGGRDGRVTFRVLNSDDQQVFAGQLSEAVDRTSFELPRGWYRFLSESGTGGARVVGSGAFAVIPRRLDFPLVDSPFGLHVTGNVEGADLAARLGAGWVRWHGADILKWSALEPVRGEWLFPDSILSVFDRRGLNMLGVLGSTPAWASRSPGAPAYPNPSSYFGPAAHPPMEMRDWSEYVRSVTHRYSGIVNHWEVWNEPDIHFLVGGPSGKVIDYIELWRGANEAGAETAFFAGPSVAYFVTQDPLTETAGKFPVEGFLSYRNRRFLEELLGLGYNEDLQLFTFHHYAPLGESPAILTSLLSRKIVALTDNASGMEVWVTEYNVLLGEGSLTDEFAAASQLVRDHLAMFANGIDRVFTFAAFGPTHGELSGGRFSNFFRNASPTPRLMAYALMTSILADVESVEMQRSDAELTTETFLVRNRSGSQSYVWFDPVHDNVITIPKEGVIVYSLGQHIRDVTVEERVELSAGEVLYLVPKLD